MGKKGGGSSSSASPNYGTPPEVSYPDIDISALLTPLMDSLSNLTALTSNTPSISLPKIDKVEPIDWIAKQQEATAQALLEAQTELSGLRGRNSTLLTSPLVDGASMRTIDTSLRGN